MVLEVFHWTLIFISLDGNIEQKSIERKENLENQPNVKESCVLSTVSVQNTLTAFVSYWSDKNWIGCLDTMLLWLHDEIEPDWLNQVCNDFVFIATNLLQFFNHYCFAQQ